MGKWLTVLGGERLLDGIGIFCVIAEDINQTQSCILSKPTDYLLSTQFTRVDSRAMTAIYVVQSDIRHYSIIVTIIATQFKHKLKQGHFTFWISLSLRLSPSPKF